MKPSKSSKLASVFRLVLGAGVVSAFGAMAIWSYGSSSKRDPFAEIPTALVSRTDLSSTITAPGEVDSSEKTLIECEIEDLDFRNGGTTLSASGSSAIIELVPEGTVVKKGDVLCQLNAAEYIEMTRQQQIELEEDRAELLSARLEFEKLEVSLREYRDGQYVQLQEQMMGQITLARADFERQKDRVAWSERMLEIGYLPLSRLAAEKMTLLKTEIDMKRSRLAFDNLKAYTAPKMILTIEGQLEGARAQLSFHESRVRNDEDQLALYQEQVDNCTIRAPHDGFLIYANEDDDDERIELGTSVREDQDLFYLPNLNKMEVKTLLNETVIRYVDKGMPAQVRIEAFPNVLLEGEVISVAPLPVSVRSRYGNDEVKNYEARVVLNVVPKGLLPGMSALVEVQTDYRPNVLVVPPMAVTMENGRDLCYVIKGGQIEKRPVILGKTTNPQFLEIVSGVNEGDRILADPKHVDPLLVDISKVPLVEPTVNAEVASLVEPDQPAL